MVHLVSTRGFINSMSADLLQDYSMRDRAGCKSYSSKQGSEHLNRSRDWGSCKTCHPMLCRSVSAASPLHADISHGQVLTDCHHAGSRAEYRHANRLSSCCRGIMGETCAPITLSYWRTVTLTIMLLWPSPALWPETWHLGLKTSSRSCSILQLCFLLT